MKSPAPTVAIVGLGVMGRRMLTNMVNFGSFTPVAAWDPAATACDAARETCPGIEIADDPHAMIAGAGLDAVYIATPPDLHKEYAIAAAGAGRVVYCEKPLGTDVEESRDLVAHMKRTDARGMVNFTLATAPAANTIAAALADGSLGDIRSIDIHLHFCQWPRDWQMPAAWLSERAEGGFVRETFSHFAYLTRRLLGDIELISAATVYPDDDISAETHAQAMMDCSGVPVTFNGGTGGLNASGADRVEYTVWGSKRAMRLHDWNRLRSNDDSGWIDLLQDVPDTRQEGYRLQLEHAAALCRGEVNDMPSFDDALAVQELVEDILSSD